MNVNLILPGSFSLCRLELLNAVMNLDKFLNVHGFLRFWVFRFELDGSVVLTVVAQSSNIITNSYC